MPRTNQKPTRLSARVAYARNAAQEEIVRQRGRPRKHPAPARKEVVLKDMKKVETVMKKRASPRKSKDNKENVEKSSSEADSSSEGEDVDDFIEKVDEKPASTAKNKVPDAKAKKKGSQKEEIDPLNKKLENKVDEDINDGDLGDEEYTDDADYFAAENEYDLDAITIGSSNEDLLDEDSGDQMTDDEEDITGFIESDYQNLDEASSDKEKLENGNVMLFNKKRKWSEKCNSSKRPKIKNVDGDHVSDDRNEQRKSKNRYDSFSRTPKSYTDTNKAKKKEIKLEKESKILLNGCPASSSKSFHRQFNQPLHSVTSMSSSISSQKRYVPCGNVAADEAFRWLIHPITPERFFQNMFEKTPYHIERNIPLYYTELFNCNDLNSMLKENNLQYGVHIDVLKYVNNQRIPIEAGGKAYYSNVWEDFKSGYSVRVRNPQAYNRNLWNFCSILQEYFSSSVGVNVYLTPPEAQGFPPHYDDIDAFIAQVEGTKHWKIYAPRNPSEDLARYSSIDFEQNDINVPIMEITLNPGDMLYIPRGYIHQAATNDSSHSLHLTFSCNQLNTWGDLLLEGLRKALERSLLNDIEFRRSIPRDFMNYVGSSVSDNTSQQRTALVDKLRGLAQKTLHYLDPDETFDSHALRFIRCSLPPTFNKIEKQRSIHGNGSVWENGVIKQKGIFTAETEIRLIRTRNIRLIIDEDGPKLYHNLENDRDPKSVDGDDQEACFIEFEIEAVPAFTLLLKNHPSYVKINDLPIDSFEEKLSFTSSLYESGLLMTKEPLSFMDDDFDWSMSKEIVKKNKDSS